jgi:hypothetical protein
MLKKDSERELTPPRKYMPSLDASPIKNISKGKKKKSKGREPM